MRIFKVAMFSSWIAVCATFVAADAASQEQPDLGFRDDFTGTSLRPEWTVQNQDPDRMALTEDDYLMIITNSGGSNKLVYNGELPESYEVTAKIVVRLNQLSFAVNVAYLSIERDSENSVALGARGDGSIVLTKHLKGEVSELAHRDLDLAEAMYLKIIKRGPEFEAAYSFDGSQWTSIGKQFFISLNGRPVFGGFNWNRSGYEVADTGLRVDYFEIVPR